MNTEFFKLRVICSSTRSVLMRKASLYFCPPPHFWLVPPHFVSEMETGRVDRHRLSRSAGRLPVR